MALMVMVEVEMRDLVDLTAEVALEVIDLVVVDLVQVDLKVIGLSVDIRGAGGLGGRSVGQMAPMLKPRLGDMYQEESEEDGESFYQLVLLVPQQGVRALYQTIFLPLCQKRCRWSMQREY